jgi:hypothetical protein
MPPFSARPAETDAAQQWVARAPLAPSGAPTDEPRIAPASEASADLDPKAPPTKTFNLRLNAYELELLRRVAAAEFCSQQAIAKRILIRALAEAAAKL